ncbi:helicase-associated domain-containing protein [Pseudactinotalea suaedae]|uniref:helicase-associated domain-containing protein n=1 Tax=Pseudactinotalea suaedae TaxID=1524924 RepID=UPI0012E2A748|nr:helicase-associated domain-containing protein [Pseudactinotalea suaedae]
MATSDPELAEALRAADDRWLAALLEHRSDLGRPVPSSVTALAARAGTRASAGRALAALDARDLTTLEALVVLCDDGRPTTLAALSGGLGIDAAAAVARLRDRALVVGEDGAIKPAPGVAEAVGPTPLGLGPRLRALEIRGYEGWPTTAPALRTLLGAAPEGARTLLDALTWGPPVGTLGTEVPPAARWLLDHHVLHRLSATEVVLPREVALAARGNRLARDVPQQPPVAEAADRRPEVVAAEVVAASDEILRHLGLLLDSWTEDPPATLRAGGLAARDVKQLATTLGVAVERAALVAELAGMLGLVGHAHIDDGPRWAPTPAAEDWRARPPEERWAELADAWLRSARVPWLAGTRNDRGALRSALSPDLHRSWAAPLRRRALTAVAAWPHHAGPSSEQVRRYLAWTSPRSVPPAATLTAVLAEAETVGLLGAGALGEPARALLTGGDRAAVAASLRALYPAAVSEMIVQGDLTGVVPGRPSEELARLLEACADVDSRGAALTVRFTTSSVGRALEAGWSDSELLARLQQASRAPLPQPLEYMVRDVARRHRRVRVQPAATVIQVDDEAAALALLSDPRLAALGLRTVGPTALAADATPLTVHDALRSTGAAPVLESSDGKPLQLPSGRARASRPAELEGPPHEGPVAAAEAVAAMRAGERRAAALLAGTETMSTPGEELALLRAAAARGSQVRIVVAGGGGTSQERLVRPLSVEAGRVRALDAAREAEITVATHRIVSVRPA